MVGLAWLMLVSQSDSQAVLRRAQRAQAEFEWTRRARVPVTPDRPTDRCDEPIGRFCYWHDPTDQTPPPEPASIAAARTRLLRILDSAAVTSPGDAWITGQRVRYLVESGADSSALTAARACGGTDWWCAALAGYALHAAGDFAGADSAYAVALRAMPREERCRWNDVSLLVQGGLRRQYRLEDCAQRSALEARVWWLAQPLLSHRGNDRRTEHYSRLTMARLLEHAWSPYGDRGGDDLRELIVRYGWPIAWSRVAPASIGADAGMVGYDREPAYPFMPEADALRPRERYAPAYARDFRTLAPDFAVFHHGDSTLVVAAYDVAHDTLFGSHPLTAALVLARGAGDSTVIERRAEARTTGLLVAAASWPARLASLEIIDSSKAAARARAELPPWDARSPGLALSDPLVFEPLDSLPDDLAGVLPHVIVSAAVARGTRVGLYWELYGLAPMGETVAMSVGVVPQRTGLLRRVAQSVGLASRSRRVRIDWHEDVKPRAGVARRALILDVSRLAPGDYRIEVVVTAAGRAAASARRPIHVLP